MSNGKNGRTFLLQSEFHVSKAANSHTSQVEELDAPAIKSCQLCFRLLVESMNL
jgi:hypothetical protein